MLFVAFFLAAFSIFSLFLILVSLINVCLGVFLLWLTLYGIRCASHIPEFSKTLLISFHSLFFIIFCISDFHQSVFHLTYLFFCLCNLLLVSFSEFFILVIEFWISTCLVFKSSISLFSVSSNWSILASIFFAKISDLLWNNHHCHFFKVFFMKAANLHLLSCFPGVLSSSLIWLIFFCLFILYSFLSGFLFAG